MSHRTNTVQQQFILAAMRELVRFLTSRSIPPPQMHKEVKQLRDDLLALIRAGSADISVDRHSSLPEPLDQERQQ